MHRYSVKVRNTVYLWGSAGITVNMTDSLLLQVRNDVLGEPVRIETQPAGLAPTTIGTLQPGESFEQAIQLRHQRFLLVEFD